MKKSYCKKCNKKLSISACYTGKGLCSKCYRKTLKGKNNPNFGNRKLIGKNNPMFGKKHLKETVEKMRKNKLNRYNGKNNPNYGKRHDKKNVVERHHIDLNKENNKKSNILLWTKTNHIRLHQTAYRYLVNKGLVRKYIKWFVKRYYNNIITK